MVTVWAAGLGEGSDRGGGRPVTAGFQPPSGARPRAGWQREPCNEVENGHACVQRPVVVPNTFRTPTPDSQTTVVGE
jgi:hypothetical protein